MARSPKVFVTQKPPTGRFGKQIYNQIDLSPAQRFGELVYLSNRREVEDANEQAMLHSFRERLREFDSEYDYLLPMGHTITMAIAAIVAAEKGDGRIKILQWDKRLRKYEVFMLDLNAQPN